MLLKACSLERILVHDIMTTHVERIQAMAHAKAIFAVDNLKMSPVGEAVARQLVAGDITPEMAIDAIAEHHRLRRATSIGKQQNQNASNHSREL